MTKEQKLFSERLQRVETAIHLCVPDRIPADDHRDLGGAV